MVKDIWQLVKDTFIYGLGKGILLPLGLIALPIFTRVFNPDEYGVIELVITITAMLNVFLTLGMSSAVQRSYFDSSTHKHKKEVVSTGLWFLLAWNLLVVGIIIPCSGWISFLAFSSDQYFKLLIVAFITVPFSILVAYSQDTIRLHFSPWKFTIVSLLSGMLTVGLSILLLLQFKMGLWGYFIGILTGTVISLAPALYFIREEIAFTFSLKRLTEMLSYGGPLVPAALASYVLTMADRFFLVKFATLGDVGLYAIAVKLTGIMLFFNMAFGLAWPPLALKLYAESQQQLRHLVSRILKYILLFFFLLAILLTIFASELLHLFTTEQYFGAVIAIAPLCLGGVALATTQVTALGISLSRKTKYIALGSGIAALFNLGLNTLLVPLWGILGASIATAISYIVLTLAYFGFANRLYPIDFDGHVILRICAAGVLFVIAGVFIAFDNLILNILLKLSFILAFIVILFVLKVFDAQEMAYIRQWLLVLKNKYFDNIFRRD